MSKPESKNGSSAVSRRTFLKSSLAVGVVSGVTQAFHHALSAPHGKKS